jgi:hypothetical protein
MKKNHIKLIGAILFVLPFFCLAQSCCYTNEARYHQLLSVNDTYEPGDVVQVIDGKYKDLTGVVQNPVDYKNQILIVKINNEDVSLYFHQVQRIAMKS